MSKTKKNLKKREFLRFCGQHKFLSWHLALKPLGSFNNVAIYRRSSKYITKKSLQSILNKNSPWVHMELEFNVLGFAKTLLKYVVYLFK